MMEKGRKVYQKDFVISYCTMLSTETSGRNVEILSKHGSAKNVRKQKNMRPGMTFLDEEGIIVFDIQEKIETWK